MRFWLPFAKRASDFERPNVRRISAPFAGMTASKGDSPLALLQAAYQRIAFPTERFDTAEMRKAVAAARNDNSLTRRQREEVDLIDAKIDLRAGEPAGLDLLLSARKKLETFLRTARTPAFLSEARGWLARIHYLTGNQAAAGKIYLDELNRNGSNLSRETLLNSLRLTYGYDGGAELLAHLDEYFDTPEHAAFAIQLVTNPHRHPDSSPHDRRERLAANKRIVELLDKHNTLLRSSTGASALALLAMRSALRLGDPGAARRLADAVPADAAIRAEPDFLWMHASALFLSREHAAAEQPLLTLFHSGRSSLSQRAAAAYALCGVYRKAGNIVEQLRFALWLHTTNRRNGMEIYSTTGIGDVSLYWAVSGWDLGLLLDAEAPIEALESFVTQNPALAGIRLVKYSLAVRLARVERYEEAARIYESIQAVRRAPRMRRLAELHGQAHRAEMSETQRREALYKLADFLNSNQERIFFNDLLWGGFQRYVFTGSHESGLTRVEREALIRAERELKDDQEERWRAYLILNQIVRDAGRSELGRRAAVLGLRCLRGISDRFGRQDEIRKADIELSAWLQGWPM